VNDDAALLLLKAGNSDGCLGVSHVDEGDNTLFFLLEITLAEEAVLVGDGSAFINDT
jgi:hypothetical protein